MIVIPMAYAQWYGIILFILPFSLLEAYFSIQKQGVE